MSPSWKTAADAHISKVLEAIPAQYRLPRDTPIPRRATDLLVSSGLLSAEQLAIVDLDATALRDALAARTYTAVQVATAYGAAAALAHQATNCLADYFLDEALERAAWLDGEMERSGKPVGPLHGVPVSVKGGPETHSVACVESHAHALL